ncbi:MAG: ECF RNA polymerase sigma factor SigW [Chlamydiae bacterium]|nr:ECF RNA polymerase sigma factor SigW [Chlamydiota bacterium]
MDEKKIIERCLEGDEEAFSLLVQENRSGVVRHCLGIVKDEEIAEDLTQETFLHAFSHLTTFRQEAKFSTWLWRIAHNLSLNYLKKKKKGELPLIEEQIAERHKGCPPELFEEIEHLLPEKHRLVFSLYYQEGLPQKEIAKLLGIPYGTVRSRLHYARNTLQSLKSL